MVNVNIWFLPRCRSTVLTRCLSNIPGSRAFIEPFQICMILERLPNVKEPEGENTAEVVLDKYLEDTSQFRILKDTPLGLSLKPEYYHHTISPDSVNVFLVRHPALVLSSKLKSGRTYFDSLTEYPSNNLDEYYDKMETLLNYANINCKKPPLVVPSTYP